jgi:hypothetical protein
MKLQANESKTSFTSFSFHNLHVSMLVITVPDVRPTGSRGARIRMNESAQDLHIGLAEPTNSLSNFDGFSAECAKIVHAHWLFRCLIAKSPHGKANPDRVSLTAVS